MIGLDTESSSAPSSQSSCMGRTTRSSRSGSRRSSDYNSSRWLLRFSRRSSSLRSSDSGIIPVIALILLTLFGGLIVTGILMTIFRGIAVLMALIIVLVFMFVVYAAVKAKALHGKGLAAIMLAVLIVVPLTIFLFLGPASILGPPGWLEHGNKPWFPEMSFDTGAGGVAVRGAWPAPAGSVGGAIFDAPDYRSSFRGEGAAGEKIFILATFCGIQDDWNVRKDAFTYVHYYVSFSQGGDWVRIKDSNAGTPGLDALCKDGVTVFLPLLMDADGKPGWFKTEVAIISTAAPTWNARVVAAQIVQVYDGTADITEPRLGYTAKVGESVGITFRLGNACASSNDPESIARSLSEGGGWSAAVYSKAQSMLKVAEWKTSELGCGGTGTPEYKTVHYTVAAADFGKSGSVCENELYIELYNNLYMVAEKKLYTLDISKAFELPKPTLKADKTTITLGQSVTLTANTTTPDVEFLWIARYKSGEIFKEENTTVNTWSVTPPRIGDVEIAVNCRKSDDCSMSQSEVITIYVLPAGRTITDIPSNWLPLILFILILIVSVILVLIYVPMPWKAIAAIVIPAIEIGAAILLRVI